MITRSTEDIATPTGIQRNGSSHIAHVVASLSRRGGGVSPAVRELAAHQAECGLSIVLLGLKDAYTARDLDHYDNVQAYAGTIWGPGAYGYSLDLKRHLFSRYDVSVVHCHGLWMYPTHLARRFAVRRGIPLVVSPHGMLDSWALRNSAWKKRIAGWLCENRNLRSAACIHALCESEYRSIRAYGLTNPVCIIPNGVDLPEEGSKLAPLWAERIEPGRKIMLFLGRIHPKKGLPDLIDAWSRLKRSTADVASEWTLVIAGWDQNGHEEELRRKVTEKGLGGDVVFIGPVFDDAKRACFENADAFILPSLSEGLPMSVLEAWLYSLPVIMTRECNIPEGFAARAAVEIQAQADSIEQGLTSFLSLSDTEQEDMGVNGRRLVETRFTWPQIVGQMLDIYRWCLGQVAKPSCIRLC